MSENVIFCYSGTGNCLDMAKHIAHELGDTDIIMMRRKPAVTDVREAKRVGFVFPCYAGGLPEGVEESLRTIKATPYSYKFAVCQFAGYAGNGLAMVDRLFPLDYWRTVSHHCSCIWLFPHNVMSPPMSVEGAQKRSARVAKEVAQAAKQGVHLWKSPKKHSVFSLEHKVWPLLAKKKAAQFSVTGLCVGCGTCVKLCPRGNIKLLGGKPQFGTDCIQCLGCLQYCPQEAITLGAVTAQREHYHNPNISVDDLTQSVIHID